MYVNVSQKILKNDSLHQFQELFIRQKTNLNLHLDSIVTGRQGFCSAKHIYIVWILRQKYLDAHKSWAKFHWEFMVYLWHNKTIMFSAFI